MPGVPGTGSYSVQDAAFGAVGDGTTDDATAIQNAINAAAGHGPLRFPAAQASGQPAVYLIGSALLIPSNSHLIIEAGATIRLANGANCAMFTLINNATQVIIDLFGTLDGNRANQTSAPAGSGIGVQFPVGTRGGVISHCAIRGGSTGLITNCFHSPLSLAGATDVQVSGLAMTNCAHDGGSAGFNGFRNITNNVVPATIAGGAYVGSTGICTLTTTAAHGFVPGEEFGTCGLNGAIDVTGTGGFANAGGCALIALPGTAGSTLIYQGPVGGADGTITGGSLTNWSIPRATIASGVYTRGTLTAPGSNQMHAVVTLTTTAPHNLTYGQTIMVNATAGSAATVAAGVFTVLAGSSGTTLRYTAPDNGVDGGTITAGTVNVSTKCYNSGLVDCYVDNIIDYGLGIYGGGVNCYVRNCEVTRCQSGGVFIFSDANFGRSIGCEISGCYVHDNYASGIIVVASVNTSVVKHQDTRIFDNYITRNKGGIGLSQCDGVDCSNNRLCANAVQPTNIAGITGDLTVGNFSSRVKISNNAIRDPCQTANALVQITSGSYNNATGAVSLTTSAAHNMVTGCMIMVSGLTGTGANLASLNGAWQSLAGTTGTSVITYTTAAGLGAITITGGQVVPAGFGIMIDHPEQCLIDGNSIGDYQPVPSMLAGIGGTWSTNGFSQGNTYGPRINTVGNFPSDMSVYANGSVQGISYDAVTFHFSGQTRSTAALAPSYPPTGLTIGYNYSGGHGDVDFLIGSGSGYPGGFDFLKVVPVNITAGTYNNGTAVVALTTRIPHGLVVGNRFAIAQAAGTDSVGSTGLRDIGKLNALWIVTAVGTSTTLTFTLTQNTGGAAVPWTGLDILSITGGVINASTLDGGGIDTGAGVNGSLFANDGFGNTRLGGALVHGAMQTVASLVNAGTVTVNQHTSMVLIRNSASIAAATIVLPTPATSQYATGAELELNFQNPIGALTWSGATVSNAPTTVATAGASVNFINNGTTWLRRIAI